MGWRSMLFLCIVAIALLVGIVIYSTLFNKTEVIKSTTCNSNDDCSSGQICNNGTCERTKECNINDDCGIDHVCNGGRCSSILCNTNSQCQVGSSCQRGQCQRQTCISNVDCTDSSFCIGGICVPNSCKSSYQCPNGYGCGNNGVCYKNDLTCSTSDDCYNGAMPCISGICNGPGICPSGWLMTNGFCYPIVDQLLCGVDEYPIAGACCNADIYFNHYCTNDNECGGSNPYCLDNRCRCKKASVPQTFPIYPFAKCSDDSTCLSGTCSFEYCVPPTYQCVNSGNCTTGSVCIDGICKITGGNMEGAYCISNNDYLKCMSSGRSCVNAICTSRRGNIGDICITSTDCITGLQCNNTGMIAYCSTELIQ